MFGARYHRWLRDAAVLTGCVAMGFFAVAAFRLLTAQDGRDADKANPRIALSEVADAREPTPGVLGSIDSEAPGAPAPSPAVAVERFLTAEATGDYATSYGLLSAPDRTDVASAGEWQAAHGELPVVTGFALGPVRTTGTTAEVDTAVTFDPSLDETRGLVPARAQAVWITVTEDGGWRVAHSESRLLPQYPDDVGAVSAAEEWAEARTACRAGPEYEGGLIGTLGPVEALCDAPGGVEVGTVTTLQPGVGVEPFLAAFGPEVLSWARVVPIASPVALEVVLAPVGDRWVVVGALESSPGGSS